MLNDKNLILWIKYIPVTYEWCELLNIINIKFDKTNTGKFLFHTKLINNCLNCFVMYEQVNDFTKQEIYKLLDEYNQKLQKKFPNSTIKAVLASDNGLQKNIFLYRARECLTCGIISIGYCESQHYCKETFSASFVYDKKRTNNFLNKIEALKPFNNYLFQPNYKQEYNNKNNIVTNNYKQEYNNKNLEFMPTQLFIDNNKIIIKKKIINVLVLKKKDNIWNYTNELFNQLTRMYKNKCQISTITRIKLCPKKHEMDFYYL